MGVNFVNLSQIAELQIAMAVAAFQKTSHAEESG